MTIRKRDVVVPASLALQAAAASARNAADGEKVFKTQRADLIAYLATRK